MKIEKFDETTSTNDYLKSLPDPTEDVVAIAAVQTGGRGTKGRSFVSERGGCYLSVLKLFPCRAEDAFTVTENAALAVCHTLAAFGADGRIKWPNDVFVNGKKICGILIENTLSGDRIRRSVVGIGVNVNNPIAPEIRDVATSVREATGKEVDLDAFVATLVYNLYREFPHEEYVAKSLVPGREITVVKPDGRSYRAVAETVTTDGRLKLVGGELLSAAEVKINL